MHYGHPDVFDRVFHITRGGISKASRIINISEDIYAGIQVFTDKRYYSKLVRNQSNLSLTIDNDVFDTIC